MYCLLKYNLNIDITILLKGVDKVNGNHEGLVVEWGGYDIGEVFSAWKTILEAN